MSVNLRVVDDPSAECAVLLNAAAGGGGGAPGTGVGGASAGGGASSPVDLVITGGSTPAAAYRQAAASGGDWSAVRLWFSDERCVEPGDDRSNYRLARENLLEPLGDNAPRTVMRIEGERGFEAAADGYDAALRDGGPVRFALVLLGLGPDAHIASMFPDQASLSERSRLAVGVPQAGLEPYVPRVTLTLPALRDSEHIIFLVTGDKKADAVSSAFGLAVSGEEVRADPHVPASMLVALHPRITVLLDAAAASRL